MSEAINLSTSLKFSLPSQTKTSLTDLLIYNHSTLKLSNTTHVFKTISSHKNSLAFHFPRKIQHLGGKIGVIYGFSEEGSLQKEVDDDDFPVSVEFVPICGEIQFDRVIAESQQLEESVIVVWMASWCRKCIYLKPKLEKLAADYYPRLRFYCVDVNNVPHKLVTRAGVTKMPTIQLWKDGQKQAEVIGGHKAHFVISEVGQMIENPESV